MTVQRPTLARKQLASSAPVQGELMTENHPPRSQGDLFGGLDRGRTSYRQVMTFENGHQKVRRVLIQHTGDRRESTMSLASHVLAFFAGGLTVRLFSQPHSSVRPSIILATLLLVCVAARLFNKLPTKKGAML